MQLEHQVLYAAVKTFNADSQELVSVALMQPQGPWLYAEMIEVNPQLLDDDLRKTLKLRCVPGTTFVARGRAGEAVVQWLDANRLGPQEIRVENEVTRKLLGPLVEEACQQGSPELTWRICRFSNASLADFYRRSGGVKPRTHSLVDALGIAFCDLDRQVPMDVERIHHLEMVMGTKGAHGYRAWGRRHEAANRRLNRISPPAAMAA